MTELRTCAHCGTAEGELTEFNGRLYCPDCLDDLTLVCTDCGSRFLRIHNRSENDDFPICPECYDRGLHPLRPLRAHHRHRPLLVSTGQRRSLLCRLLLYHREQPHPRLLLQALPHLLRRRPSATSAWNWRSMTVVNVTAARRH